MPGSKSAMVELVRETTNALNPEIVARQLGDLVSRAVGKTYRGFGWRSREPKVVRTDKEGGHGYSYALTLVFYKQQQRVRDNSDEVFGKQFGDIARRVMAFGRGFGWKPKAEQSSPVMQSIVAQIKTEFAPKVPDNYGEFFSHLFNLDAQIDLAMSSLKVAIDTGFEVRNHLCFFGPPGCGKSDCALSLASMIGEENVLKLDATATTKAGAENLILEMDACPPVLILEEAEKCNPANLPWLLGVLDERAEIRKTTAKIGSVAKDARCFCISTVNDMTLFKSLMSGALASRFPHKVYFGRPHRAVLEKILRREVHRMNGDMAWVKPCLDYALEIEKTTDPRRVKALLDGREKWLTGEYQRTLMALWEAMEAENVQIGNGV